MISDIAELQLLIKKEEQRGDELDKKMTNKWRLLQDAEDKKWKIIRKMLQQQLAKLQEQNMIKEQQLIEIQKRKVCTLEEVFELEEKFAASGSFILYFLIFTGVFTYSYAIFIYVCYSDLVSFIFLIFDRKR